jgi:hypothetical protein
MRIEAGPLAILTVAILAGCTRVQPTPYQPVVDGYGYIASRSSPWTTVTTISPWSTAPRFGEGEYIGGGFGSDSASPSDSYTAHADVVMFKGEKPAADVNAYDARSVLRRLGLTIEAAPGVARRTVEQLDAQPQAQQQ